MRKLLSMAIIASMTMVSCSKQENPEKIDFSQDKEIKLNAGITASTKAVIPDNTTSLTKLQFLRVNATTQPTDFSGSPLEAELASGKINFETIQNYSRDENHAYFVSYYPEATSVANNVASWTLDGSQDILYSGIVDGGSYASLNPGQISYGHQMSMIKFILQSDNLNEASAFWGNVTAIKVKDVNSSLTFNYSDLSFTAATPAPMGVRDATCANLFASMAIPNNGNTTINGALMIWPTGAQKFTVVVTTATKGDKEIEIDLGNGKVMEKSKFYTVTLTFKSDDKKIEPTATIGVWEDGGTGSGEVK